MLLYKNGKNRNLFFLLNTCFLRLLLNLPGYMFSDLKNLLDVVIVLNNQMLAHRNSSTFYTITEIMLYIFVFIFFPWEEREIVSHKATIPQESFPSPCLYTPKAVYSL